MPEIAEEWDRLLRDSDPNIRRIAEKASLNAALRRLWPYASHGNLRFSRTTSYPYDGDLPYVLTTPDGSHEARGGNSEPLSGGSLDEIVARVADAVAELVSRRSEPK